MNEEHLLDQRQSDFDKGTKKRRVMTAELVGKFRSKSDFIKYFSENRKCLQLNFIVRGERE